MFSSAKIPSNVKIRKRSEVGFQRPNFSARLAGKVWQELATRCVYCTYNVQGLAQRCAVLCNKKEKIFW
jgi:hypothetical protein